MISSKDPPARLPVLKQEQVTPPAQVTALGKGARRRRYPPPPPHPWVVTRFTLAASDEFLDT